MKKILLWSGLLLLSLSFIVFKRLSKPSARYTIGILQTASHPALDAARNGFITELSKLTPNDIHFIVKNAEGSIINTHTIAQQFHGNKQITAFFTIATPATQALSSLEKDRPLIFTAVTDPAPLHILGPTSNVCGVTDMIDVRAQVHLLKQLVPTAQQIGILYSSGEINSRSAARIISQELTREQLIPLEFAVTSEADLAPLVESACRKVDALIAPTDNLVASSINLITAITAKYQKPLIVSDVMLVPAGALAAHGVDYYTIGQQAARLAQKVIAEGAQPCELPVEHPENAKTYINRAILKSLHLNVPDDMNEQVVFIAE